MARINLSGMGKTTQIDDKLHWYKDAVIYELHIKAFRDSNRDGIGDFRGLIEKLDYLQELGITAIWLLPFYPSPLKDDGYDIADYYSINPRYGTMDQFKELLEEAHRRNLKVVTELVINHTSDQHPWFQRARTAPKGSPEREFYVWSDDPQKYKDVRIIFQDFETSNWTWDPVAGQYYWHRFFHHQPDLNYDNPEVQAEIFRIIDFWCAMGVDGFRLDAVPYLFERENTNGENLPETHAYLKKLRKYIDEKYPGTAFLAEANMWPEDSASYFGEGDECHMNYHFPVMPRMFMAVQREDRYPITDIFDQTPAIPETCQWAIFLRNHDELTLEMVTDEERDFMYKAYAKDPKARINLGIRHRLAPLMDNNRNRIELMNALLFSLPGTPVIYYGDEIGMGDNFYLGDRDGVRTPMQWSPDRNAGFSETNPQQLYLPVILDPEYHYEAVNVEMQKKNTSSLFWFMKRMINLRKHYKAFGRGDMKFLQVENPKILAFTRTYEDQTILVICNLSKYAQPAEIDLRNFGGHRPVEIFSRNAFPLVRDDEPYFFTLSAHSFQWYVLENAASQRNANQELPTVEVMQWADLTEGTSGDQLVQEVLPAYLQRMKWFKGKNRKVESLSLQKPQVARAAAKEVQWLFIDVAYEDGLPETYQLAVSHLEGDEGRKLSAAHPNAIIAHLKIGGNEEWLCDAFYLPEFHETLLQLLIGEQKLNGKEDSFSGQSKEEVKQNAAKLKQALSRMHAGDENNTSITFNNQLFLKMFRKVETSIHPDVELTHFLSEKAGFDHVPEFLGAIHRHTPNGTVVLGMVQELIENHGDGQSYMEERINNFIERILARHSEINRFLELEQDLTAPIAFENLPSELQGLLGSTAAEQAALIGRRTAEMHKSLALSSNAPEFKPEEYSLHYQRSLYSSMQSLVRESFDHINKAHSEIPSYLEEEIRELNSARPGLIRLLKRIYAKKLDIWKIRIHGSYTLRKLLMTGKDIVIQDFGGNPFRSFSERRIKRSPIRDLADMIISFHYVAYEGFFRSSHVREDVNRLLPFAELWARHMSGFFMHAYLKEIESTPLVPSDRAELEIVLDNFLLEKALLFFNFELHNRPDHLVVPLRIIKPILGLAEKPSAALQG